MDNGCIGETVQHPAENGWATLSDEFLYTVLFGKSK
jgi:hypothetical protein